ncbi:hypothetical protein K474DRAFT_1699834 [Panus rudis PR-1116 ss-1]|nr:hypothetical protein K474DRAFT_1699834 [Panus rudis PR-1116 ss-1]
MDMDISTNFSNTMADPYPEGYRAVQLHVEDMEQYMLLKEPFRSKRSFSPHCLLLKGTPRNSKESRFYATYQQLIQLLGQQLGFEVICHPQHYLLTPQDEDRRWGDEDTTSPEIRRRIPDFVISVMIDGEVYFLGGCEVKNELVDPANKLWVYTQLISQVEQQAKCFLRMLGKAHHSMLWMNVIGERLFLIKFGPYTTSQLNVLNSKKSDGSDYNEFMRLSNVADRFKEAPHLVEQEYRAMHHFLSK